MTEYCSPTALCQPIAAKTLRPGLVHFKATISDSRTENVMVFKLTIQLFFI